jgi:putative redox protein
MDMKINFNGNKQVSANYKGFTIKTDQPTSEGGDGMAPEPYDLFLAALGTCAGAYIIYFCERRNIPSDHIGMTLGFQKNEKTHLMEQINMDIHLPSDFPEKYKKVVVRAAQMCTVKRTLDHPPVIQINTVT